MQRPEGGSQSCRWSTVEQIWPLRQRRQEHASRTPSSVLTNETCPPTHITTPFQRTKTFFSTLNDFICCGEIVPSTSALSNCRRITPSGFTPLYRRLHNSLPCSVVNSSKATELHGIFHGLRSVSLLDEPLFPRISPLLISSPTGFVEIKLHLFSNFSSRSARQEQQVCNQIQRESSAGTSYPMLRRTSCRYFSLPPRSKLSSNPVGQAVFQFKRPVVDRI